MANLHNPAAAFTAVLMAKLGVDSVDITREDIENYYPTGTEVIVHHQSVADKYTIVVKPRIGERQR